MQNNHISREEAKEKVSKYDGEFPDENIDEILEYLNCNLIELNENIDRHRNKEIWKIEGNDYKRSFEII